MWALSLVEGSFIEVRAESGGWREAVWSFWFWRSCAVWSGRPEAARQAAAMASSSQAANNMHVAVHVDWAALPAASRAEFGRMGTARPGARQRAPRGELARAPAGVLARGIAG